MSEDGILTGLPSSAVGGNFYVYATNNYSTTQRLYTLSVKDPDQVPVLGMASMLAWDETFPGLASWGPVDGAAAYRLQLYRDSDPQGGPVDVTAGREYDFLPAIEETGTGIYHFSVTALGDGVNYVDGLSTGPSEAGYDYAAPLIAPAISILTLPEADLNEDYSQILTATGDPPISWSVTEGRFPLGSACRESDFLPANRSREEISLSPSRLKTQREVILVPTPFRSASRKKSWSATFLLHPSPGWSTARPKRLKLWAFPKRGPWPLSSARSKRPSTGTWIPVLTIPMTSMRRPSMSMEASSCRRVHQSLRDSPGYGIMVTVLEEVIRFYRDLAWQWCHGGRAASSVHRRRTAQGSQKRIPGISICLPLVLDGRSPVRFLTRKCHRPVRS